jgi:hypothetical protein
MRPANQTLQRFIPLMRSGAILVLFTGLVLAIRWGSINYPFWLNPDEAELLAQGNEAFYSPVPFSTWATTTSGPLWAFFLGTLKLFGFPLTIVSGHLIAALLVSTIGFLAWSLARAPLGFWRSLLITLSWWLPLAIGSPLLGPAADFNAMTTELLPLVIVMAIPLCQRVLAGSRGWLCCLVMGFLAGMASLAKYQVAPLAIVLVCVLTVTTWKSTSRRLTELVSGCVGFLVPFALTCALSVFSGVVNYRALKINLDFLLQYSGSLSPAQKMTNLLGVVLPAGWLIGWLVLAIFLACLDRRPGLLARLAILSSGLVSVFAGGIGFPHYLQIAYVGIFISIFAVPQSTPVLGFLLGRRQGIAFALILVIATANWFVPQLVENIRSGAFGRQLTIDHHQTSPALAAACPPGSKVLVWGWASELYVDYQWRIGFPIQAVSQVTNVKKNIARARRLIDESVDTSDCVFDATGAPFFGIPSSLKFETVFPEAAVKLQKAYRQLPPPVKCDTCSVWVRRSSASASN